MSKTGDTNTAALMNMALDSLCVCPRFQQALDYQSISLCAMVGRNETDRDTASIRGYPPTAV